MKKSIEKMIERIMHKAECSATARLLAIADSEIAKRIIWKKFKQL